MYLFLYKYKVVHILTYLHIYNVVLFIIILFIYEDFGKRIYFLYFLSIVYYTVLFIAMISLFISC